jgi:chromosome partitioning protein
MRAILVANAKGGVGKTTVAVTLAAALARQGHRVALADADRQGSSLRWLDCRPPEAASVRPLDWRRGKAIGDAPKKLDWLVIDAPGAIKGDKAEALVAESDRIVAPLTPSIFDLAATEAFLDRLEEIKRVRKGKASVHVVANRARKGRALNALLAGLEAKGHAPAALLTDRAAYPDLAAQGLTVFDRDLKSCLTLREAWQPLLDVLRH